MAKVFISYSHKDDSRPKEEDVRNYLAESAALRLDRTPAQSTLGRFFRKQLRQGIRTRPAMFPGEQTQSRHAGVA